MHNKTVNEWVDERNRIIAERDAAQKRITEISDRIKGDVLDKVIGMGLYDAVWEYSDNPYGYNANRDVFTIEPGKINDDIQEYLSISKIDNVLLYSGVILCNVKTDYYYTRRLQIIFDTYTKTTTEDFIKKVGLKVDTKCIDEKIAVLQKKKNSLIGGK